LHEGFGLAALEALAAELPLVASGRPPMTEFLDQTCATLVDPLSEESIAAGVLKALDRATALPMLAAGQRRAGAYSWEHVGARHVDVYVNLLRRAAAGAAARAGAT
jgi:glycosyltransferase involved in cell wall biosynthesis